jgi:putative transposase
LSGFSINGMHQPETLNGKPELRPGGPIDRAYYLPRLPREYYQGDAVVHWTLTMFDQAKGWLSDRFHQTFRELILHTAAREKLLCPTYCLMPDHMHFIWMGLSPESDQLNGMSFLRTHLKRSLTPFQLQRQPNDHVLRSEQRKRNVFSTACWYILDNPVKAGLVQKAGEWPFCGSIIPGYPILHPLEGDYWPKFWKLYFDVLNPKAREIKRPPFSL